MAFTTVNKSIANHKNVTYTGNGGSQTITGVGFTPDFVWFKSMDAGNSHALVDSVRGTNRVLYSDTSGANQSISAQTFNSDGFALVQDNAANSINSNSSVKTALSWRGGTTSGLSGGTITPSSYSFNAAAGFSIIKYTGTGSAGTIPHGLGVAPEMVMVKSLNTTENWYVYFKNNGATHYQSLDTASNSTSNSGMWNDTAPTSTLVSIGSHNGVNQNTIDFIMYCFAPVQGYCRIGRYRGNSSLNGAFIYTGFKPQTIIVKEQGSTKNWYLFQDARLGYNGGNRSYRPDIADAEQTTSFVDFLSNGFKFRDNDSHFNAAGNEHSYIAWGQTIVGTNDVPGTAK